MRYFPLVFLQIGCFYSSNLDLQAWGRAREEKYIIYTRSSENGPHTYCLEIMVPVNYKSCYLPLLFLRVGCFYISNHDLQAGAEVQPESAPYTQRSKSFLWVKVSCQNSSRDKHTVLIDRLTWSISWNQYRCRKLARTPRLSKRIILWVYIQ